MKIWVWIQVFIAGCLLAGCSQLQSYLLGEPEWQYCESGNIVIRIMTYNVENLFDAAYDGDEYTEYDPREGTWDLSGYHQRLARLRDVLLADGGRGADVIILQEIEHAGVLEDLVSGYLPHQGYSCIAATEVPGSAIEVGIISRIPIVEQRMHVGIIGKESAPRPLLEAVLETPWGKIHVFNSHWKSKIGGAEETEPQRIACSSVLRIRIAEIKAADSDAYVIAGGDFNATPWEYADAEGKYPTALQIFCPETDKRTAYPHSLFITGDKEYVIQDEVLYSPWLGEELETPGTYVYRGSWEAIDHLLVCDMFFSDAMLSYCSAEVPAEGLTDDWGAPKSWDLHKREGYSDHLPLVITVIAEPNGN